MHALPARVCVEARTHLVTASYVSDAMRDLDRPATAAGVLLLNEVGLDPGIDHISAMALIDRIRSAGGEVTEFSSYCGGLPAVADNNNPWGYKFSWSPAAVLRALDASARYRFQGKEVDVSADELLEDVRELTVDGVGQLESYPNRDSLEYGPLYGLEGAQTLFRGTLRYPGWAETLSAVRRMGLLQDRAARGTTWAGETAGQHEQLSQPVAERLAWLGLFDEQPLSQPQSVVGSLVDLMKEKLAYAEGERDLVVMRHDLAARYEDRDERISATLVTEGEAGGDTAMARTVGIPVGIATRLVLEDRVGARGVAIPTTPELYQPILAELAACGIELVEQVHRGPQSEG